MTYDDPRMPHHTPQSLVAYPPPVRVEVAQGVPYGLAIPAAPQTVSGVAIGSAAAGIGSILVSGAVWCFGALGAQDGWGAQVGGAFAVLSGLLAIAAVVLGILSMRQIRREPPPGLSGRGFSLTGIICGSIGLASMILALVVALALALPATT